MRRFALLLLVQVLISGSALAGAPGGAERAAAESLFRQANELSATGEFSAACPKYEASQKLDPALGTMLRLADCWDRIGRSASAWALFLEAASLSSKLDESEREQIARQRALSLEERLTKVTLKADFDMPQGYELSLGGTVIDPSIWSSPIPIDPGTITLSARAPGYEPRSVTVTVKSSAEVRVLSVPELTAIAAEDNAPKVAHPMTTSQQTGGWQKPTAIVVGSIGLAGLATGGVLALLAKNKSNASLANCAEYNFNLCNADGVSQRNEALNLATGATVSLSVGGALLVTGLGLLILSPSSKREMVARGGTSAQTRELSFTPLISPSGGAAILRGSF